MFSKLNLTEYVGGFQNPRCQCYCGTEYVPSPDGGCPACGKLVPRAMASEAEPWMSPQEWKLATLRRMLESGALEQVPAEHRETMRANMQRQIRQLEDGSWKVEAKQRIHQLRRVLKSAGTDQFPVDVQQKVRARTEVHIRRLTEELELAGETVGEDAMPALGEIGRGVFTRPRVTAREWAEDPMHVLEKVAMAIMLHVHEEKMTPVQRHVAFGWYYLRLFAPDGGGYGPILINSREGDGSIKTIREMLETICTPAHVAVFQKALDQWKSKPRHYAHPAPGDRAAIAKWAQETLEPIQAEFREIDRETMAVTPTLADCITAFLGQHRDEFVEVVEAL